MEDITALIAYYRKRAVGYRTAASKMEEAPASKALMRAAILEDVAADLEAWVTAQEAAVVD